MFSMRAVRRLIGTVLLAGVFASPASAAPIITKTYSYFQIGGKTAEDLDKELEKRGPLTRTTGHRHPGATEIKFGGEVTYVERANRAARVTLRTHIVLPRWINRRRADADLGMIWDTLSADIKRHEERHAEIARTHARILERQLLDLSTPSSCDSLEKKVADATRDLLEAHDREQMRFDQVESKNFDERMTRLLKYRMKRD